MVNEVIYPDYIENLNVKISFSNYEIVADKKYEKQAMIFNNVLAKSLAVDESKQAYHIEFFHNKDLRDNQYVIQMDNSIMHIEVGNKQALSLAINVVSDILSLSKKIAVKKLTAKAYYMENNMQK